MAERGCRRARAFWRILITNLFAHSSGRCSQLAANGEVVVSLAKFNRPLPCGSIPAVSTRLSGCGGEVPKVPSAPRRQTSGGGWLSVSAQTWVDDPEIGEWSMSRWRANRPEHTTARYNGFDLGCLSSLPVTPRLGCSGVGRNVLTADASKWPGYCIGRLNRGNRMVTPIVRGGKPNGPVRQI